MKRILNLFLFMSLVAAPVVNASIHSGITVKNSITPPRLTVQAPTCEMLSNEVEGMRTFTKNFSGDLPPSPLCECDSEKCSVVLDSVLPESFLQEVALNTAYSGPNCFNTSLRMAGLLEMTPRISSMAEMKEWLKSPLCRQLAPSEKNLPGDLILVSFANGDEYHGFTYFAEGLAYSKSGFLKERPFLYQTLDDVYLDSHVPLECRRIDVRKNFPELCKTNRYAEHFRCETYAAYRQHSTPLPLVVEALRGRMSKLESEISKIVLFGYRAERGVPQVVPRDILNRLVTETHDIRMALADLLVKPQHEFLVSLAFKRIAAIADQIELISPKQ